MKKTLGIVFLTVFLDLVGFGIIIPIQPFYAEKLGADPWTVTLLGASFSLMQFLFAPFWGRLSDRIGRRPVMLVSIAMGAIGYLMFGLSRTLTQLFAARILSGFGAGNIGTAQAIIADCTTPENRAKGMGIIGAAFGLGFIFGPAIGGMFVGYGLAVPAYIAAGLGLLNWLLALAILPETYQPGAQKAAPQRHRPGISLAALKNAARHPNVTQLFCVYLVYTASFSLMEQVLGLFIEHSWRGAPGVDDPMKHAAMLTTYFLVAVGVTATIVQGGLIGRLSRRFGERRLISAGALFIAFSVFGLPFVGGARAFGPMLLLAVLMATGTGILNPSLSSLLSRSVDRDEQGGALGLGQGLGALGRVIGPTVAGALFQYSPNLPFWSSTALMLLCLGITFTVRGPTPAREVGAFA